MNQPTELDLDNLVRVCEEFMVTNRDVKECRRTVGDLTRAKNKLFDECPPSTILSLLHRLQEAEKRVKLYDELLYAVGSKCPNETRHETALRYIRERERPKDAQGAAIAHANERATNTHEQDRRPDEL